MKILRYICFSLAAGLSLAACEKRDEAYKDFMPNGEITYPGKVDSLKANPGYKRMELTWLLISDNRIEKCRVYWNRNADSMEIAIKRSNGTDTIKALLTLPEGPYIFDVYTYDGRGNRSIKQEVSGDVYGDFYADNLLNRVLKTAVIAAGNAKLDWDEADPRSTGVELTYTDQANVVNTVVVPSTQKTTIITGIPKTGTVSYRTMYLPVANAIDTFRAKPVKVNL